jgi:hypothetical protein
MPVDPAELLPWFRSVEKIFGDFKIEQEYHLFKPFLTATAAALVLRLGVTVA